LAGLLVLGAQVHFFVMRKSL